MKQSLENIKAIKVETTAFEYVEIVDESGIKSGYEWVVKFIKFSSNNWSSTPFCNYILNVEGSFRAIWFLFHLFHSSNSYI